MSLGSLKEYANDLVLNFRLKNYISYQVSVALSVLIVTFLLFTYLKNRKKNFPPGPWGLPIVGYLPFLDNEKPFVQFQELAKKYGPVFSLRLGSKDVVVLNSAKAIREAFSKPETLGRPPVSAFSLCNIQSPFFSNGKVWLEQRRFSLHAMRDHGLGKIHMQEHIHDEIRHFVEAVEKEGGKPFDIITYLTPSMSNNISSLVFGKRYEYDDPDRILLDKSLDELVRVFTQTSSFLFFPWLTKIPLIKNLVMPTNLKEAMGPLFGFVKKEIENHKKNLDPNHIRDLIDSYLLEMKAKAKEDPTTTFSEETLLGVIENLFGAGSETVRTTIGWCLCTMAAYPDVQKKVQEVIDHEIGRERLPVAGDMKQMPYVQSVLMEIQRWQTVVAVNLLRYALEDTSFCGYDIPKGTFILANLMGAHRDPGCWKNPDDFVPDRFLAKDGKSVNKTDDYLVFSYGKRNCPGEGLAVLEVFLYFVSILQKFDIKFPEGVKPTFEGDFSVTYQMKPFKIRLIPRN